MQSPEKERTIATFCVVVSVFTYGSVAVFLRFFTKYLDSWTVNAVRYAVAAMIMLPFVLLLSKRSASRSAAGRNIWRAAIVPSIINIIGQVGWAMSPYYQVEAATMGFVTRSSFLFAVLFSFLFIPAERLLAKKPFFLAGAAVCMGGVAMMFFEKMLGEGSSSAVGMAILVGTAMFWGAYAVSVRQCLGGYALRLSFGVVSIYTAAGLLVLMLVFGKYHQLLELGDRTGKVWGLLAASAVIGMVFSHMLYYRGIHGLGPVVANGIIMAAPLVTYIGALVLLGEKMTLIQFVGGLVVVIGGVFLIKAKAQIVSL